MGTMNVYIAGASKLIASLALEGALPRVLAGDSYRSVPRRPLVLIAVPGVVLLVALVAGFSSTDALIRATSACFIGVYVLALLSAVRILEGATRAMAAFTLALTVVLAGFSSWYLAVPIVAAAAALGVRRSVA
jgi:amino acid efflux transporter